MKNISGIYAIYCSANNKYYIGSSTNIRRRWKSHRTNLNRNIHSNNHLQNAFNIYGKLYFSYIILEILDTRDKKSLEECEEKWVLFYKSHKEEFGFNKILPGSIRLSKEDENKTKEISTKNRIGVVSIEVNTGIIDACSSTSEAVDKNYIKRRYLEKCIGYWRNNKHTLRSYKGKIYVSMTDYNPDFNYIDYKKPRILKPRKKKVYKKSPEDIIPYKDRNIKRVPIISVNIMTKEETHYSSIKNSGFNISKVYKCLKNEYGKYSHRGYYFKYLNQ